MTVSRLRARFGRAAATFALIVLGAAAVPAAVHMEADDPACDPQVSGRADGPAFGTALHENAEHCAVCHWLRALRAFDAAPSQPGHQTTAIPAPEPRAPAADTAPSLRLLPSRAPPSLV